MPLVSQSSIDEIIKMSDIVSIVQSYGVPLQNRGSRWFGCCPFHSEKTPSFSVTPEQNLYYCFGCRAGGNVISFVKEMESCSFGEAVEILAKKSGIVLQYESNFSVEEDDSARLKKEYTELYTRVSGTFHYLLMQNEIGKFALNYIRSRGISDEILVKFNIGYAPHNKFWLREFLEGKNFSQGFLNESGLFTKKNPRIAFFSDRLMFPICDRQGNTVAFGGRRLERGDFQDLQNPPPKYMNSGDLPQYKKGETLFAFNIAKNAIRKEKKVIFCEGYMDCIAYHQCGIDFATAPLGTALTDSQIRLVRQSVETVFLSFDSDEAGQNATKKAILLCRANSLSAKVIRLQGGKDPAEIMQKYGAKAIFNAVENAISDFDWLFSNLVLQNPNRNPESIKKIERGLFEFADSLSLSAEKETALEQIAMKLGLSKEAISNDYLNREIFEQKIPQQNIQKEKSQEIAFDAELRAVCVFLTNPALFPQVLSDISSGDFENPHARLVFDAMKDCQKDGEISLGALESRIENKNSALWKLVSESIARGEFSENANQAVSDGIKMIKRKKKERRRAYLQQKIGEIQNDASGVEVSTIIEEIMEIDKDLKT